MDTKRRVTNVDNTDKQQQQQMSNIDKQLDYEDMDNKRKRLDIENEQLVELTDNLYLFSAGLTITVIVGMTGYGVYNSAYFSTHRSDMITLLLYEFISLFFLALLWVLRNHKPTRLIFTLIQFCLASISIQYIVQKLI